MEFDTPGPVDKPAAPTPTASSSEMSAAESRSKSAWTRAKVAIPLSDAAAPEALASLAEAHGDDEDEPSTNHWYRGSQVLLGLASMAYLLLVPARFCFEYAVNYTYVLDYAIDLCVLLALGPTLWELWLRALGKHDERWQRGMRDHRASLGKDGASPDQDDSSQGGAARVATAGGSSRKPGLISQARHEHLLSAIPEDGAGASASDAWPPLFRLRQVLLVVIRLFTRPPTIALGAFASDFGGALVQDLALWAFVFPWDLFYLLAHGFEASYPLVPLARLTRLAHALRIHSYLRKLAINQSYLGYTSVKMTKILTWTVIAAHVVACTFFLAARLGYCGSGQADQLRDPLLTALYREPGGLAPVCGHYERAVWTEISPGVRWAELTADGTSRRLRLSSPRPLVSLPRA
jgi:hypothetical protein